MDLHVQALNALNTAITAITNYGLNFLAAILLLIVGWFGSRWVARLLNRGLSRLKACDEMLRHFLTSAARYGVLVLVGIMVLEKFGVQTASLITILGAAGLAIGLALQGTLQNIAAGIMLLAFRPFKVGDYIVAGSLAGTVEGLSLFLTDITTPEGIKVVVPNAELWNKPITNYSANPTRRQDFPVGISYADDVDAALAVLLNLAGEDDRILADPAPQAMVTNLGESSVDIQLRAWMKADDFWPLKWDMARKIKLAMDASGITIPFPQRDIHIHQA
ncbi:MAG TPA: mechanosensitive ion channel protein MscS [Rhodospirillaceae bacterium]|nr:MAG: hypothetical protein A2018_04360 [Alphaproteobacteria bacterium GWF2_58_20]HAU28752.1 mechanosensitive ion channel protein MscS [Rhodospirillaceae bacterium]